MRPRRRAAALILGAVVLFVIGTNAEAGWLFVLAALLLGTVVAGLVVPLLALRGLDVELVAPAETRQGLDTPVQLTITNRGHAVRWGIVAHDRHVGGATTYVGPRPPGEGGRRPTAAPFVLESASRSGRCGARLVAARRAPRGSSSVRRRRSALPNG